MIHSPIETIETARTLHPTRAGCLYQYTLHLLNSNTLPLLTGVFIWIQVLNQLCQQLNNGLSKAAGKGKVKHTPYWFTLPAKFKGDYYSIYVLLHTVVYPQDQLCWQHSVRNAEMQWQGHYSWLILYNVWFETLKCLKYNNCNYQLTPPVLSLVSICRKSPIFILSLCIECFVRVLLTVLQLRILLQTSGCMESSSLSFSVTVNNHCLCLS